MKWAYQTDGLIVDSAYCNYVTSFNFFFLLAFFFFFSSKSFILFLYLGFVLETLLEISSWKDFKKSPYPAPYLQES